MTTDEKLDRIATNLDTLTRIHLDSEREWRKRLDKYEERDDAADERAAAADERAAAADERAATAEERHNREMAGIRAELRHAVRIGIQEARAERRKRRQLADAVDEKITQLAAAQLVTEEKLQRMIDARHSGNGGNGKS